MIIFQYIYIGLYDICIKSSLHGYICTLQDVIPFFYFTRRDIRDESVRAGRYRNFEVNIVF